MLDSGANLETWSRILVHHLDELLPSTATDQSRGNTSAYLDAETNVTRRLLANLAARYEDYSDFGSRVSTKLALRLQAAPQLVLRAAANTGFRAPSLAQSYYGSRITNFKLDPATGKVVEYRPPSGGNPHTLVLDRGQA